MLQIFRKGRQIASDGTVREFTAADLEAIAKAYDVAKHEAPIVVGHPESDMPAYGWVKKLAYVDGHLEAEPHQVDQAFADLVEAGRFKKISASFWPPGHKRNPTPDSYYLRHIGFLGAQPPAVKGLRVPQFAADDEGALEFGDWGHEQSASLWRRMRDFLIEKFDLETADRVLPDWQIEAIREAARKDDKSGINPIYSDEEPTMTPEEAKRLQEENTRLAAQAASDKAAREKAELQFAEAEKTRKAEADARAAEEAKQRQALHVAFADELVKEGKLLPAQKPGVLAMLGAASAAPAIEFEEGGAKKTQPQLDFVKGFLKGLPKVVEYSEVARGKVRTGDDSRAAALKAQHYQDEQAKLGNVITIAQAVEHVTGLTVS